MSDTSRYVAKDAFVDLVRTSVAKNNPNDPATEIWDEAAIKDLANYLEAMGYAQGLDEELIDLDTMYAMYDLLKWTRGNGFTVELDGELI